MRTTRAKRAPPAIPATSIMDAPFRLSATELKALCSGAKRKTSEWGVGKGIKKVGDKEKGGGLAIYLECYGCLCSWPYRNVRLGDGVQVDLGEVS